MSRLTAVRGKLLRPVASASGPPSVVPASAAMKCGSHSIARFNDASRNPDPTIPVAESALISSTRSLPNRQSSKSRRSLSEAGFAPQHT